MKFKVLKKCKTHHLSVEERTAMLQRRRSHPIEDVKSRPLEDVRSRPLEDLKSRCIEDTTTDTESEDSEVTAEDVYAVPYDQKDGPTQTSNVHNTKSDDNEYDHLKQPKEELSEPPNTPFDSSHLAVDSDATSGDESEIEPIYATIDHDDHPRIVLQDDHGSLETLHRPRVGQRAPNRDHLVRSMAFDDTMSRGAGPRRASSMENLLSDHQPAHLRTTPGSAGFSSLDRLSRGNELRVRKDNPQYFVIYLDVHLYVAKDVVIGLKNGNLLVQARCLKETRHGTDIHQLKRSYRLPYGTRSEEIRVNIKDGVMKIERELSRSKPNSLPNSNGYLRI